LIEKRGGFLKAIGLNSPGGQLTRECNTINFLQMLATISASASPRSKRAPLAAARSTKSWIAGYV